jgi:uncharacterized membrane protein YqiK
MSAAIPLTRSCARIQSRLDRDALAHLREHCAEQATRIAELESQVEALQRKADAAAANAEMWAEMWNQQRDHDLDVARDRGEHYRIGITQDCQIVRLPASFASEVLA